MSRRNLLSWGALCPVEVYPIVAVISGAVALCGYSCMRHVLSSPDVQYVALARDPPAPYTPPPLLASWSICAARCAALRAGRVD